MESTLKKQFALVTVLIGLIIGLWGGVSADTSETKIRIAILKNTESFVLSIRGPFAMINPKTGKGLVYKRRNRKNRVKADGDGIHIGVNFYPVDHIRIELKKDVTIYADKNKRRYRGAVDIVKQKDGRLLLINSLDIERYVRGVLYHEITDKWPMEAMKAQAIASRSYALYQIKMNKDNLYDVTSDIYSQVYGGRSAERYRTNLAVKRTKGEYLIYEGEVLPAYFHSNSGGHTEDVANLWKHDLPPLKGVNDPFAVDQPGYHWVRNFKSSEEQVKLNNKGVKIGLIKDIKVVKRNQSGRVENLKIESRDGRSVLISGKKFRDILGPNHVKSLNFEVVMKGYYFDLIGKGWGHGVGMSQWGAHNMAKQRKSYQEILEHYYPGATINYDAIR